MRIRRNSFVLVCAHLKTNLWCATYFVLFVDSSDVRKSALLSLIKKAREEEPEVWNEYFNAMLLILLETVADDDVREPS